MAIVHNANIVHDLIEVRSPLMMIQASSETLADTVSTEDEVYS